MLRRQRGRGGGRSKRSVWRFGVGFGMFDGSLERFYEERRYELELKGIGKERIC